jgi:hypothetical protein
MLTVLDIKTGIFTEIAVGPLTFSGRFFPTVFCHQVRAAVQNGVRCVMTKIEKERFIFISFYEFNGLEV